MRSPLTLSLFACLLIGPLGCDDDTPSGVDSAGETSAGAAMAGEMTAGESPAGETSAGTAMAGEMTAGESPAGESPAGETSAGTLISGTDRDQDGVDDVVDNCPDLFNPEQSDLDGDQVGDACEQDSDQDGLPDTWDPAPNDPDWPGRALPDTVYAHTDSDLYALSVKGFQLNLVASFTFDVDGVHRVTDIAFDRSGVLWAITFNTLWLCHPRTGECRSQGRLPFTNFNGLTFLPGSFFDTPRDVLVGIDIPGAWRTLILNNGEIESELLGMYPNETSSGDAFSIEGVGTFAAVKRPGLSSDLIISVNPNQPREIEDVVVLEGYNKIYGLAGWRGALFAFDETGAVLHIDLETRQVNPIGRLEASWWGAGVSSVLYTEPDRNP